MIPFRASGDVQRIFKPIESRIANVCPIKEADQVEETQPRNEAEVQFEKEFSVLSTCKLMVSRTTKDHTIFAFSSSLSPSSGSGGS